MNFVRNVEATHFKKSQCLSIQMEWRHFTKENEFENKHEAMSIQFLNEKVEESIMT